MQADQRMAPWRRDQEVDITTSALHGYGFAVQQLKYSHACNLFQFLLCFCQYFKAKIQLIFSTAG